MGVKGVLLGLLFTVLYASGAVAMKFGLQSAQPLTLATIRFLIAGVLMLTYVYIVKKGTYKMPNMRELGILFLLGLLNTALFLGLGLLSLQTVSSSIFNLFIPINSIVYALLAFFILRQVISLKAWSGMILAFTGLVIASYPSLVEGQASIGGMVLLMIAILSMAFGSIIYKKTSLNLPFLVVNTWQLFFGGLILIVPTLLLEANEPIKMDATFFGYLFWSVCMLSIFNLSLWFYLLKKDAIVANNWLLLNPIAGYILGALLLNEIITSYAVVGTLLVLTGLYLSGNFAIRKKVQTDIPSREF